MAKKWFENKGKNPYSFEGGVKIAAGEAGEVEEKLVSKLLIQKKLLVVVEAPKPDAPTNENAGADGWTIEEMAEKLIAEPDLLDENDDFTTSGVPKTDALSDVFERSISGEERDQIWTLVGQDDGSD